MCTHSPQLTATYFVAKKNIQGDVPLKDSRHATADPLVTEGHKQLYKLTRSVCLKACVPNSGQ